MMLDMIIGAKNEIIATIVGTIVVGWLTGGYYKFRALVKKYKKMKQELDLMKEEITRLGATKEEHERLTAELQRKDEALRQAEKKSQEDSRRIEGLQSQLEAAQAELQRKNEALKRAEKKQQEDSRRIEELQSQVEALQEELQQEKAKKKIPPMSDSDFLELCKSGDARKVEEAIMNGANVNAKDNKGKTALMQVASWGKFDIAKLLVEHGADINATDNNGWTALAYATSITSKAKTAFRESPLPALTLLFAVQDKSHNEIAQLLRAHGAK